MSERLLEAADYGRLLAFRTELRSFLHWSEQAAAAAGLTPSLHQLLLVVRGHRGPERPTIGDVADTLHVRHHSAVELTQRAEAAGLLLRDRDVEDHRRMRLELTPKGERQLQALTSEHLPRIAKLAETLEALVEDRRPR